jgi:hypothetical protein
VYFGGHNVEKALHEIQDIHHSYLLSVKATEDEARASLLYSYKHSINGFAALLTPEEASKLSGKRNRHRRRGFLRGSRLRTTHSFLLSSLIVSFLCTELEEVIAVSRSDPKKYSLHTTRSWEFIGLAEGEGDEKHLRRGGELWSKARYGKDVIVGLLDSGKKHHMHAIGAQYDCLTCDIVFVV